MRQTLTHGYFGYTLCTVFFHRAGIYKLQKIATENIFFNSLQVFGLLVWALIAGTEYFAVSAFGWVMFVAVFYWVLTVFLLIFYITAAYTKIPQVPWTTVGLCFNASAALFYLIASIVDAVSVKQAAQGSLNYNNWAASSFFAFIVTLCYSGNTFLSFQTWRSKDEGP
uniref:CKLF-like MARVEL transmembrane domain containing 8b n=1 Tax=Callorhinchus milii TaxID=7868 RepID=A0A4W3KF57_CALMI